MTNKYRIGINAADKNSSFLNGLSFCVVEAKIGKSKDATVGR